MNVFEIEIRRRTNEFLIITKVASNCFCLIAIFSNMNVSFIGTYESPLYIFATLFFAVVTTLQIYFDSKNKNTLQDTLSYLAVVEIVVFLSFYTTVILFTGWQTSEFKILYIFAVLVASVQYSLVVSICVSSVASLLILLTNVISFNSTNVHIYLQRDIALIGTLFLLSYLIGYYKKIYLENNLRYQRISELMPSSIIIYDNQEILYTNESGSQFLNKINKNEILEDKFNIKDHIENSSSSEDNGYYTREIGITIDNLVREYAVTSTIYPYNNDFAVISIINDISERKRAEALKKGMEQKEKQLKEAVEYDRLKTEFFSNMSHEFKTPINIVLSTLQLFDLYGIKEQTLKDEQWVKNNLKIIKQNCYRLLRLVSNILDLTRIDANFSQTNLSNYDVIRIVEDITMSVVNYIENKGISLCFDTELEEKVIACDPDKIEKILLNLLSNAVKYTDVNGSIFVNIYDKGDRIYICVKDTGTGIPEDKLDIIFDRFRQVDELLIRRTEGSGIGLSLVKSLVELHGGKISVNSQLGKGTEFIVDLPCRTIDTDDSSQRDVAINQYINSEVIEIEFSDIYK
jgi:signal transduction histidine kinase